MKKQENVTCNLVYIEADLHMQMIQNVEQETGTFQSLFLTL
jgi:hypothetical protein